ncbi:MAG: DUF4920 domain-containing protein [Chitinophagaceae bacterium]|nr:DUF4920 domain-containing protein [Chitinophagaceae bacterium]
MKYLLIVCCLFICLLSIGQQPTPAEKGIAYGSGSISEGVIHVNDVEKNMKNNKFEGRITGKVVEVCQEKGCWMKIERSNGEKLMVKFKDYGFFMPKNIVGKEVVLDGEATVKEVSVKQQKHYAEDAGKSKEEIEKIKEPKKELQFVAKGVLVL